MLTIHHLNASRSDRIIWLMEELGLPYRLERYQRETDIPRAPASLAEVHPLGKAPVIVDDDGTLIESGAIVEYIIHRYGEGRLAKAPTDAEYSRYLQWLHFAEGSLMSGLLLSMFMSGDIFEGLEPHPLAEVFQQELGKTLSHIDDYLATSRWFAGDAFSAADIMMGWGLAMCRDTGRLGELPHIHAFLANIEQRPAYQKMRELA